MTRPIDDLGDLARALGYAVGGFVLTALVGLLALPTTARLQGPVYDALYLRLGPSGATETAIFGHALVVAVGALAATAFAADAVSDRLAHRRALAAALGPMAVLVLAFLALAAARAGSVLTAIGLLAVGVGGVLLALRYRFGVRSAAIPAMAGGLPVVLVLVVLAAFGVGWGWGYAATAEQVPAEEAPEDPATFEDAPQFGADLLDPRRCETAPDGTRECRLELRGYERERRAARFMAANGVRCPYSNAGGGARDSFVVGHDGEYYRISCVTHGD